MKAISTNLLVASLTPRTWGCGEAYTASSNLRYPSASASAVRRGAKKHMAIEGALVAGRIGPCDGAGGNKIDESLRDYLLAYVKNRVRIYLHRLGVA